MAVTYPLTLPSHTGISGISLRAVNAVAYERSPFTFAGQAQASSGEMWAADVTLPPMKYHDAERWIAFLVSLRGQFGTFTMGDPLRTTTRGLASGLGDTLTAAGVSDYTVTLSGATPSTNDYLLSGDYIQIGNGTDGAQTLHKVLAPANSLSGGGVSVDVWPRPRRAVAGLSVSVTNTVGLWRLASNETEWSINEASIYGLSFSAMEAV